MSKRERERERERWGGGGGGGARNGGEVHCETRGFRA